VLYPSDKDKVGALEVCGTDEDVSYRGTKGAFLRYEPFRGTAEHGRPTSLRRSWTGVATKASLDGGPFRVGIIWCRHMLSTAT
jgi:hypothetical protein